MDWSWILLKFFELKYLGVIAPLMSN